MPERSIRRLAGAMLLQAVEDAGSNSVGKRNKALHWMKGRDNGCFSFPSVCRVLDRDPDQVRRFCERRAAEHRRPRAPFRITLRDPFVGCRLQT